jgi:hypothetical protein
MFQYISTGAATAFLVAFARGDAGAAAGSRAGRDEGAPGRQVSGAP